MAEPIKTVIARIQKKFEIENKLNPFEIEINNDRVLNILKKYKNVYCEPTPFGILFSSSVTNNTKQIFVTCRKLNHAKKSLINGKMYSLTAIIKQQKNKKINSWENIKEKSLWVNATFNKQEETNNGRHLCFPFITSSLNDLLNFRINLMDNKNKQASFKSHERK